MYAVYIIAKTKKQHPNHTLYLHTHTHTYAHIHTHTPHTQTPHTRTCGVLSVQKSRISHQKMRSAIFKQKKCSDQHSLSFRALCVRALRVHIPFMHNSTSCQSSKAYRY
eukprot:GEMP01026035.1.p1 GENE.GEMP01026035.1~~GEMP01026035.1.p1  ORF type:complete len:109 (-),score=2.51 GEMP01026035.1:1544-1870(-)